MQIPKVKLNQGCSNFCFMLVTGSTLWKASVSALFHFSIIYGKLKELPAVILTPLTHTPCQYYLTSSTTGLFITQVLLENVGMGQKLIPYLNHT